MAELSGGLGLLAQGAFLLLDDVVIYRNPWAWLFTGGVVWGIIGLIIASTKGRSGWGCCLGCLLGPFGLLLTMLMPDER